MRRTEREGGREGGMLIGWISKRDGKEIVEKRGKNIRT
jgi:hypothetical protein